MLDETEALLEALKRQRRRRNLLITGIIASMAVAPFAWIGVSAYRHEQERKRDREEYQARLRLQPGEADEIKQLLDEVDARAGKCQASWKEATSPTALRALRIDEAPCATSLMEPTVEAAESYVQHGSIDANYFGGWTVWTVRPGDDIDRFMPCVGKSSTAALRAQLANGRADRNTLRDARELVDGRDRSGVLFLVADESTPSVGALGFTSGHVRGRALLFDGATGRIVCGADVEAKNHENVSVKYRYMAGNFLDKEQKGHEAARDALDRDLEVQLRKAIARGLRSASVPSPAEDAIGE